ALPRSLNPGEGRQFLFYLSDPFIASDRASLRVFNSSFYRIHSLLEISPSSNISLTLSMPLRGRRFGRDIGAPPRTISGASSK
ncbi:MAG: hypothetical protein O2960_30030, partial [Verrucomicrobia bacterium]|nr:hypothetical protein [Verrucomicrobiota bacterium]